MAKRLGRLRSIAISTDGGTTWTPVGNLTDGTWNGTRDEVESTDADSGDSKEFLAGRQSHTLDFTCRYNEADAGQAALETAFFDGTTPKFRWRSETLTGIKERQADGIVTALNHQTPDADTQNLTGTIRITGAVTKSTQ